MADRWFEKTWVQVATALDHASTMVDEALDEAFGGVSSAEKVERSDGSKTVGSRYHVVSNDDKAIVVAVDVPGVRKGDIEVELGEENRLLISGKREGRGSFNWKLRLADEVDPSGVSASLADGVLTVTAKKLGKRAQGRKIPIG